MLDALTGQRMNTAICGMRHPSYGVAPRVLDLAMPPIAFILLGYLLGSIPFGLLLTASAAASTWTAKAGGSLPERLPPSPS